MKEFTDKALGLDIPEGNHDKTQATMFYGDQNVPHPTNRPARIFHRDKILSNVMDAD